MDHRPAANTPRPNQSRLFEIPMPTDLLLAPVAPIAKVIYLALLSLCSAHTRTQAQAQVKEVVANQRELARELGIERHTLYKHAKELMRTGWLQVEADGTNVMRFILRNPVLAERFLQLEQAKKRLSRAPYIGEALMKEWLTLLVDVSQYDDNARPGFLCNPSTGENLEYDRWYAPSGHGSVAFEFNGPQHYQTTDNFPDLQQVAQTKARDYIKKAISRDQGVTLITVHPEDLTSEGMQAKVLEAPQLPLRSVRLDDPILLYLTDASNRYIYRVAGKRPRFDPRADSR